jgi:RNA polymerase sigma-70 factor (ECF subfamily)
MSITRPQPDDDNLDALIESVKINDRLAEEAKEKLFLRFYLLVFSIALRYLRDKDAAEDATHDVFVKAICHIRTFRHSSTYFSSWLARIAHNHCKNLVTRERKPDSLNALEGTEREPASRERSPEEQVIQAQGHECLMTAIGRLPPIMQAICLLYYIHRIPTDKIARIIGCKQNTIPVQLFKARRKLRDDPDLQAWYGREQE